MENGQRLSTDLFFAILASFGDFRFQFPLTRFGNVIDMVGPPFAEHKRSIFLVDFRVTDFTRRRGKQFDHRVLFVFFGFLFGSLALAALTSTTFFWFRIRESIGTHVD